MASTTASRSRNSMPERTSLGAIVRAMVDPLPTCWCGQALDACDEQPCGTVAGIHEGNVLDHSSQEYERLRTQARMWEAEVFARWLADIDRDGIERSDDHQAVAARGRHPEAEAERRRIMPLPRRSPRQAGSSR